jgi:hypothetical protein
LRLGCLVKGIVKKTANRAYVSPVELLDSITAMALTGASSERNWKPQSDPLVFGDHIDAFRDDAICHLESVLSSHHIEEKITNGERSRFLVRVAEQEYVVQNPTDRPTVFIIRHNIPKNCTVTPTRNPPV